MISRLQHSLRTLTALVAVLLLLTAVLPPEMSAAGSTYPDRVGAMLAVDGEIRRVMAYEGDTVGDLLKARGVTLGANDDVYPAAGTVLYDGISIAVVREQCYTVTEEEVIPCEVERIANEYMPKGTEKVHAEGSDGLKKVTYSVVTKGGRVVSKTVVSTETVTEAVPGKVEYGPGGTITTPSGETIEWSYKIDGQATAYTTEKQAWKRTRSGTIARVGAIAVDPKTIPLGSKVYVEGSGWVYGLCSCEDTGGAIKGTIIDLFFNTEHECWQFGRRSCTIYVISTPEK